MRATEKQLGGTYIDGRELDNKVRWFYAFFTDEQIIGCTKRCGFKKRVREILQHNPGVKVFFNPNNPEYKRLAAEYNKKWREGRL